jgi:hypothetical protein
MLLLKPQSVSKNYMEHWHYPLTQFPLWLQLFGQGIFAILYIFFYIDLIIK